MIGLEMVANGLEPEGDQAPQVFRIEKSIAGRSPQRREYLGHLGLDCIQALVPVAGIMPTILSDATGWVIYLVYLALFVVAAVLYFGNTKKELEKSDDPFWSLIKFFTLGFGAIVVGQVSELVPSQWSVACAVALAGLTLANARVIRSADAHIPEIGGNAPNDEQLNEG